MKNYYYRGKKIFIPRYAEVSRAFQPDTSVHADVIQKTLDEIEAWEKGEDPITEFNIGHAIGSRVVKLAGGEVPLWGVNPMHTAKRPGLSPFFRLPEDDSRSHTERATIELVGTPDKPILTRIYPGEYMPPLPWMGTASQAPDGKEQCVEYWSEHAFVLRDDDLASRLSPEPPEWYRPPGQV